MKAATDTDTKCALIDGVIRCLDSISSIDLRQIDITFISSFKVPLPVRHSGVSAVATRFSL